MWSRPGFRRLVFEPLDDRRLLATFTVLNTLDTGPGSLRQALIDANASDDGGTIEFQIPATDPNFIDVDWGIEGGDSDPDAWRIQPLTELPELRHVSAGITIDGATQSAFLDNLNPFGPEIILDGGELFQRGLVISTGDNAVIGLNILRFGRSGIDIVGGDRNVVTGNYIGVTATGTVAASNARKGVVIEAGGSHNRIGTNGDGVDDAKERNIISGNIMEGVDIEGVGSDHNIVAGNFIGTNAAGDATIGNEERGVDIKGGAQHNRIGTNADGVHDAAEANVISGNLNEGVWLNGAGTSHNLVAGNFIGTDLNGTLDLGNFFRGVLISGAATLNQIGGSAPAARNLISGNETGGVRLDSAGTSNNVVIGNYIGTNLAGDAALPNNGAGVLIEGGATNNRIGTDGDGIADAAERNVISGNTSGSGVRIIEAGTSFNTVAGNFIGANAAGAAALGNASHGISIGLAATQNIIGTNGDGQGDDAERNVISGNLFRGILISDTGTDSNIIAGNYIGTNATATAALGNGFDGILIQSAARSNRVGTDGNGQGDAAERNIIAGNLANGVNIFGVDSSLNVVAGNSIGTNVDGTADLGNGTDGVRISTSASNNTIGSLSGRGNLIAFNKRIGVNVMASAFFGNTIVGNSIYQNTGLGIDLGADGVTPNDADDADIGPNNLQNAPDIASAMVGDATLRVVYSVVANPQNVGYPLRIEFFKADAGVQEGRTFLGADIFSAADFAAGTKSVALSTSNLVVAGDYLVATATDSSASGAWGSTSEFSPGPAIDFDPWYNRFEPFNVDGDTKVVAGDALYVINYINSFGSGPVPHSELLGPLYYDTDGDTSVSPGDALSVINFVNSKEPVELESRPPSIATAPIPPLPDDWLLTLLADAHSSSKSRRGATGQAGNPLTSRA